MAKKTAANDSNITVGTTQCNAKETISVNSIDNQLAETVKNFCSENIDFLKHTAINGSLTQRAAAVLFLEIAGVDA